jgi:general secretion pathway protein D
MADNVQEAKTYFLKALDINPENAFALMNMGVVYEREGNPEEALKMYQAVVSVGTTETAFETSNEEKNGAPLVDIARENIERLQ